MCELVSKGEIMVPEGLGSAVSGILVFDIFLLLFSFASLVVFFSFSILLICVRLF